MNEGEDIQITKHDAREFMRRKNEIGERQHSEELEHVLREPDELDLSVPRVWVGLEVVARFWNWELSDHGNSSWYVTEEHALIEGAIFVAGTQPKPTCNPADDMDTPLAKCDRVDW